MRVQSIHLTNFKRFSDLEIVDVPEQAKLVVVVGSNGSGKSSLFEALWTWYRIKTSLNFTRDEVYYRKRPEEAFQMERSVSVSLHGNSTIQKGSMYVRSAYRNDPDFSVSSFQRTSSPAETPKLARLIDNDQTVSENYQRLVFQTISGLYDPNNDGKLVGDMREELIGQVRDSMTNVFGDLQLNSISNPMDTGSFFFEKGAVGSYHYKNLSAGEKAAFDLILDLHLKKRYFADAIYCIDEIETHLHTRVQSKLLKELVKIIPGSSQLWIATHSLGVLRGAQELAVQDPASVCLLDFNVDLDAAQRLRPSDLNRVTWDKFMSIALDDLSPRIAPEVIVVCEGSSDGRRRRDFDADIYRQILGATHPNITFISGGSSEQLEGTTIEVRRILSALLPTAQVWGLRDRDDLSDAEVASLRQRNLLTLCRRNLESFLLDEEVIKALVMSMERPNVLDEAIQIREEALQRSIQRAHPADDLKPAAGEIYNGLKQLLELRRCGSNTDEFMKTTLAPLVLPTMHVYDELRSAIIDPINDISEL